MILEHTLQKDAELNPLECFICVLGLVAFTHLIAHLSPSRDTVIGLPNRSSTEIGVFCVCVQSVTYD